MTLSQDLKIQMVREMRYIAGELDGTHPMGYKNYIFSGAHAMTNRILNLAFDEEFILLHSVLSTTHAGIQTRINAIAAGQEKIIGIPVELFNTIAEALTGLANAIESDEPIIEPLKRIAVAGYVTTGNGYYLYKKGLLRLLK